MRVQHNITAMNSYRNYNNNTNTINKNIEKLSSGYKINRAGDNAAGLAISEKMRAQITGLEVAQKNAKDGISLVQTAEGALTEVHSMLNRMYELAEQSANGTYEGLDRDQLQKEVGKLREEIDRIADSANFNGIKLLNGDMDASGASVVSSSGTGSKTTGAVTAATQEVDTVTLGTIATAAGDKVQIDITYRDASDTLQTYSIEASKNSEGNFVTSDNIQADSLTGLVQQVASKRGGALNDTFTIADNVYTAQEKGDGKGQLLGFNVKVNGADKGAADVARTTQARNEYDTFSADALGGVYAGTGKTEDYVFSINGYRFAMATSGNLNNFDSDVTVVQTAATLAAADVTNLVGTINRVVGRDIAVANGTSVEFNTNAGSELKLQIGDTAEGFNQMKVSIADMHAGALGIGGIDISTDTGAAEAMTAIKSAINTVSENRGTLGATQNRLEHTINNLSVMQENIQDAESTIRDTDVADEMMKYTKNSILVQSAQAMLAQANQQPQGVLQLLQ